MNETVDNLNPKRLVKVSQYFTKNDYFSALQRRVHV